MVKDAQKTALLAAKDQLLTAYTSVHTSLGHLIGLVNNSDPRVIAEVLGSGSGLSVAAPVARYGRSPPDQHLAPHRQLSPSAAPRHSDHFAHPLPLYPAPRPPPLLELHGQSHTRQASHNGPAGPSFTTIPSHPSQPGPQYAQQAQPPNVPESEEEEDDDEHEEVMVSDEDHSASTHAEQQNYAPTPQAPLKKPREKKGKRERDPNAPKRPASAYILFQNAVRKEMRAANPTVDYKELARQIGDRWKNLSEDDKRPWSEAGKQAMSSWNIQNREYKTLHPEPQVTSPHNTISTSSSTAPAPPRRRKTASTVPAFDTEGNMIKKKRGRPSKNEKVEQDMLLQHQQEVHRQQHQQMHHHLQQQQQQQPHHHHHRQQTQQLQHQSDANGNAQRNTGRWPDPVGYSTSHSAQNGAQTYTNGAEAASGYYATGRQQERPRAGHQTSVAGEDDEDEDEDAVESESESEEDGQIPQPRHNGIQHQPMQGEEEEEDPDAGEDEDDDDDDDEEDENDLNGHSHVKKKIRPSDR